MAACFFLIFPLCAAPEAVLFVSSSPLNAIVSLDGQVLAEETPLLLRQIAPGKHALEISKEGYRTREAAVKIEEGETRILSLDLVPESFLAAFPGEQGFLPGGGEEAGTDTYFRLEPGSYTFDRRNNLLEIEPVFPQQGLLNTLNFTLPAVLGLSLLSTLHDLAYPKSSLVAPLSPVTVSTYSLTLAVAGIDIALRIRKRNFTRTVLKPVRLADTVYMEERAYNRGEQLLTQGRVEEALDQYTKIVERRSESRFYPLALYKSAKIHLMTGDEETAVAELEILDSRYPLAELYDKTQKTLADIRHRQELYEQSVGHLGAMVFCDSFFSREEIDLYRCEILEEWFQQDEGVADQIIKAYECLIAGQAAAADLARYRYKLAYFLAAAGREEEALAQLALIGNAGGEGELGKLVEELRVDLQAEEGQ